MADDVADTESELAPALEPVVAVEPEPAPEPVIAEPAPAPAPVAPAMVPLRVMQERIGEETSKRHAAEEEARQAAERARSFEEIVKRLQADPKSADTAAARSVVVPPSTTTESTAVQQEAARLLFNRDVAAVSENGFKAFGNRWNDAINALNAYGANSGDFVSNVMEIDRERAHEIMFQIAQDGEKAVGLARMTPTRRVAEITRMFDMAKAAEAGTVDPKAAEAKSDPQPEPRAAPVSRAPAPKPAIAPHAPAPDLDPTTPEGNEKMDDAAWSAWYKQKYMKRTA